MTPRWTRSELEERFWLLLTFGKNYDYQSVRAMHSSVREWHIARNAQHLKDEAEAAKNAAQEARAKAQKNAKGRVRRR